MNPTPNPPVTSPVLAATRDRSIRVVATSLRAKQERLHWAEYGMEAALLGTFMVAACVFTAVLNHPSSPIVRAIPSDVARRVIMAIAMGSTALALVHSPFGKRSGAHFNPALTLTFLRLGKVARADAFFYESSAQHGFGARRPLLRWSLDLFHRPAVGNDDRSGGIPAGSPWRQAGLREAAPRQQHAMHLPVRLRATGRDNSG